MKQCVPKWNFQIKIIAAAKHGAEQKKKKQPISEQRNREVKQMLYEGQRKQDEEKEKRESRALHTADKQKIKCGGKYAKAAEEKENINRSSFCKDPHIRPDCFHVHCLAFPMI